MAQHEGPPRLSVGYRLGSLWVLHVLHWGPRPEHRRPQRRQGAGHRPCAAVFHGGKLGMEAQHGARPSADPHLGRHCPDSGRCAVRGTGLLVTAPSTMSRLWLSAGREDTRLPNQILSEGDLKKNFFAGVAEGLGDSITLASPQQQLASYAT